MGRFVWQRIFGLIHCRLVPLSPITATFGAPMRRFTSAVITSPHAALLSSPAMRRSITTRSPFARVPNVTNTGTRTRCLSIRTLGLRVPPIHEEVADLVGLQIALLPAFEVPP